MPRKPREAAPTRTGIMKLYFHAFACAAACLASAGALARPSTWTVSSTNTEIVQSTAVRFSDLDLTSPEGQRRLDARLRAAAIDVCRAPRSDGSAVSGLSPSCYKAAIAD